MNKVLWLVVILVVLGVGWWLISPFFVDKVVSEESPIPTPEQLEGMTEMEMVPVVVAEGSFSGFDRTHYGSGDVSIIETVEGYVVRFEDGFEVANGPDLFVGFGKDGEYVKGTELGKLKGNIGAQNYALPQHLNLADYNEVWIWCRAFSVGFARASLTPLR